MKRMLCMMLCLAMLCLMPTVQAEENVQEWVFRNGVTWNSTLEDVVALEGEADDVDEYEELSFISYEGVRVSKFEEAYLGYAFKQDQLVCAAYGLESLTAQEYDYLTAALTSKYSQSIPVDAQRVNMLMNCISNYDDGMFDLNSWVLADGTLIALFWDSYSKVAEEGAELYDFVYLIYFNEPLLEKLNGIYNTDGL